MRGSTKMKNILLNNKKKLKTMNIYFGLLNFILFFLYLRVYSVPMFIIYTIPEIIGLFYLYKISKPVLKNGEKAETIEFIRDLNSDALGSFIIDTLNFIIAFKASILYSRLAVVWLLLIPVAATYDFFYKPLFMKKVE